MKDYGTHFAAALIGMLAFSCLTTVSYCYSLEDTKNYVLESNENKNWVYESLSSKYCLQTPPLQGPTCTSGWAFSVTMALRHRYCIKYGWNFDWDLSVQQVLACSKNNGCEGGTPEEAVNYLRNDKLVTELCYPYEGIHKPVCKDYEDECPSKITTDINKLFGIKNIRNITKGEIVTEIMTKGAVPVCFNMYDDFYDFFKDHPDGIYPPQSGSKKREGVLCGIILANVTTFDHSWNATRQAWILEGPWGEHFADRGYFAIERNCKTRDLDMDKDILFGDPE